MRRRNGQILGCANCGNPYEYYYLGSCPYCGGRTNGESKVPSNFLLDRFKRVDTELEETNGTEVKSTEKDLEDWKELFHLLKSDHFLDATNQTGEWEIKAKAMGLSLRGYC
jgi:hypothetical protein